MKKYTIVFAFILTAVGIAEDIPPASTKILWQVPIVEQTTNYTCGPAAMQAVLAYYGHVFTEEYLSKELGTSPKDGTSHEKMAEFANKLGIRAAVKSNLTLKDIAERIEKDQPVIVEAQAWAEIKPPRTYADIWDSGHYMVVIGIDDKHLYFVDSSASSRRGYIPVDEFMVRWHDLDFKNQKLYQTAILFEGTPKPVALLQEWVRIP